MSAPADVSRAVAPGRMREGARWQWDAGDHVAALAWGSEGRWLAVAPAEGGITLLEPGAGRAGRILPGHPGGNCVLSAAPKADLILSGGQDGMARVWNTASGGLETELPGSDHAGQWCEHARFSPDGAFFATATGRTLRVWRTGGGLVFEDAGHESTIAAMAWRPDSRGVATGCYNGVRLSRVREERWETYQELRWRGSIVSLAWSPNGRCVAAGSQEATIQFWRLPARPGEELCMSGYASKVRELSWDPESRHLATGGGECVTVWDVSGKGPRGSTPRQLDGHAARITQLAYQHCGILLASGGADGRVFVWDRPGAQRQRLEFKPISPIAALAWCPDDTALAIGNADGRVALWETAAIA
jgi:WD40 repeat protein